MSLYYYMPPLANTLNEFIKCGSGFEISADRLYDEEGEPLYYHLRMFGLCYPEDYELTGYDLEALMKEAIIDCDKSMEEYNK